MKTIDRSKEIADTILAQLGGNRFLAMTGAKSLSYGDNALNMRIGRNSKGVTHVRIRLNGADLYDVTYMRVWGSKVTEKGKSEGIYADMLRADFTRETGLDVAL